VSLLRVIPISRHAHCSWQSVPGGVVNLTSKRPQFSQQGHVRLTGGTQNTKGAAFDNCGRLEVRLTTPPGTLCP
jgi:hypothetical protein